MRPFTRLTNAFSRKVEFHLYAVALHFLWYNFARPHMTPTTDAGGTRAVGIIRRYHRRFVENAGIRPGSITRDIPE
jgi:hypothetical protein